MLKTTVCSKCKKDYMYDTNTEPHLKDMCRVCYEFEKQRERGCGLDTW